MNNAYTNKNSIEFNDEINLHELFDVLMEGKRIIFFITTFISIIAVIYSLLLPNIYKSKTLLVSVNPSSNISGVVRSYSNFTSLAGINLPPSIDEGNTLKAIEKIGSLSFFENNILSNILLPDLMAVKSWDPKTNKLSYDESIYDKENNAWVREYSYPQQQVPSTQESYEIFIEEHLSVNLDMESGFVTLSIKHQSPYVAKQWTELIVNEINNHYRLKDKSESEKAVSYLYQQISLTSFSEVKEALAQLLQEQTKKLTLIEANEFYVFDYIDPPAVMEKKSEPRRALICIFSALLAGMLSVSYILARHYVFNKKTS